MGRPYSNSSLNLFNTCPKQFEFRYVIRPDIPKVVSAHLYLGNAVHAILELAYKRGDDGVEFPLDDALAAHRAEWEKVGDTVSIADGYYTLDDYVRIGEKMLAKHWKRYQPFNQGTLLGTELPLNFDLPGTDFRLTGKIDRLWKRDDGVVEICDYKTGQRLTRADEKSFRTQMGIYQLADGSFQANCGPDADGKVFVTTFDAAPPTEICGYEYNIYDPVGTLNLTMTCGPSLIDRWGW